MSGDLPALERARFEDEISALSPVRLASAAFERLWLHYQELARWNRRLSLVGPGTVDEVLVRHYGESLAALELLGPDDGRLVDVGSGGGFPGLVLAAARPDLEVTLVEAQQRKWAFLELVAAKSRLPVRCLNARVSAALPGGFPRGADVVASRAVRFGEAEVAALSGALADGGRFLVWAGKRAPAGTEGLRVGREIRLRGGAERRLLEVYPVEAGTD